MSIQTWSPNADCAVGTVEAAGSVGADGVPAVALAFEVDAVAVAVVAAACAAAWEEGPPKTAWKSAANWLPSSSWKPAVVEAGVESVVAAAGVAALTAGVNGCW